jgi:CheY-like chemotaxis protein
MVVDDEVSLLETFTEILKGLGYQAFPFTNSTDALHAFQQNSTGYDLVITDHTMPHMTGMTLANRILQIRKDIPIILMTGYDQLEDPEEIKKLGIRTILLKPFKKSLLGETLRKVLTDK